MTVTPESGTIPPSPGKSSRPHRDWVLSTQEQLLTLSRGSDQPTRSAPAKTTFERVVGGDAPNLNLHHLVRWSAYFGFDLGMVLAGTPWGPLDAGHLEALGPHLRDAIGLEVTHAQDRGLVESVNDALRKASTMAGRKLHGPWYRGLTGGDGQRLDLWRLDALARVCGTSIPALVHQALFPGED